MNFLGKIAGTMLKDNLVRNSVDLAIDSDLMYFDVSNRRIGINTTLPSKTLTIVGNAAIDNLILANTSISTIVGNLMLKPTGNVSVNNTFINDVRDPRKAQDAATKNYVDTRISGQATISDGTNTSSLSLYVDPLKLLGTQNQIVVTVGNKQATFSLPENVNVSSSVTSKSVLADRYYYANGEIFTGSPVIVSEVTGYTTSNSYSAIDSIRFDKNSGFKVTTQGFGIVKVASAGSFSNVIVQGQQTLTADPVDTIEFVAGKGINLTTNSTGSKSVTVAVTQKEFNSAEILQITNNSVSTSTVTGAAIIAGGVGIGGALNVGDVLNVTGNINGNINGYGNFVSATIGSYANIGNIITTSGVYWANGASFDTVYTNANVSAYLPSYTGALNPYRASIGNLLITNNHIIATNVDGNISLTAPGNGVVSINSTSALTIPVGNNLSRPNVPVKGMIRFNSNLAALEIYDGFSWQMISSAPTTTIVSDLFTGNGTQTNFTLTGETTTNGAIVTVNGVSQLPGIAYTVNGLTLTLNEAPLSTDIIEVRSLTTTASVTEINDNGSYIAIDTSNLNIKFGVNYSDVVLVDQANTSVLNNLVVSNGLMLSVANVPTTSKGTSGDMQGMVAVDSNNIYYCIANYTTGTDDIWVKTPWAVTGSWP
jgi:hypothetical protein